MNLSKRHLSFASRCAKSYLRWPGRSRASRPSSSVGWNGAWVSYACDSLELTSDRTIVSPSSSAYTGCTCSRDGRGTILVSKCDLLCRSSKIVVVRGWVRTRFRRKTDFHELHRFSSCIHWILIVNHEGNRDRLSGTFQKSERPLPVPATPIPREASWPVRAVIYMLGTYWRNLIPFLTKQTKTRGQNAYQCQILDQQHCRFLITVHSSTGSESSSFS